MREKSKWDVKSSGLRTKEGCNKSFLWVVNKDIKEAEGKTWLCSSLECRFGHDPCNSWFMLIKNQRTSSWDSSGLRKLKSQRRVNEAGWCQSLGKGAPCLVEATCLNVKHRRQEGNDLFPWRQKASTIQCSAVHVQFFNETLFSIFYHSIPRASQNPKGSHPFLVYHKTLLILLPKYMISLNKPLHLNTIM